MPYTDSEIVEVTLNLRGVWLHDADDESGTSRNFLFGSAQRETSVDMMGAGSFFAGRTSPVFDFGEHEEETVSCTVDVPHGPSYRTDLAALEEFARLKKAVWFRDNRGRAVFGTVSGFKSSDEEWGSTVSFTIRRAHRDVTTAGV